MGADGAAHGADGQLVRVFRPEGAAVRDVLLQEAVAESGVAQAVGPGKVDARGLLNLAHEQVVAVLGPPGLAQQNHLSPLHGDNRLNGQKPAHQGDGGGNPPAPLQILQGVQQGHQTHVLLFPVQLLGNLHGLQPLVQQLQRPFHQNHFPDGGALAVHHVDLTRKFLRRQTGALPGAGELAGEGHGYHRLPGLHGGAEGVPELAGADLAGDGQVVPLYQALIKLPVGQIDPVLIRPLAEGDGHGQDGDLLPLRADQVGGGICDNADCHNGYTPFLVTSVYRVGSAARSRWQMRTNWAASSAPITSMMVWAICRERA